MELSSLQTWMLLVTVNVESGGKPGVILKADSMEVIVDRSRTELSSYA